MRLIPLVLLSVGCMDYTSLAASHDALKVAIADAKMRERCAPTELAMAESALAFADVEMAEGEARRAYEHVNLGREQVKAAGNCATKMGTDVGVERIQVPSSGSGYVEDATDAEAASTRIATSTSAAAKPPATTAKPPATTAKVLPIGLSDRDADGVTDDDDVCMNDPEDLDGFKDSDGCPELDNDTDGISDAADKCRDAAEDLDGFQDTDGCPDTDNDADGVVDAKDGCPTQVGVASNSGCPVVDGDGDGLSDDKDKCPTVAETRNGYTDDDGCPDSAPTSTASITPKSSSTASSSSASSSSPLATLSGSQITVARSVAFESGKSVMQVSSLQVLDAVVAVMLANPSLTIEIGGHTDNEGDDAKNQTLSKDRADAVWEYLLSKGVEARRMRTVGYGETMPVDTNRTDSGRERNRRIEFLVK